MPPAQQCPAAPSAAPVAGDRILLFQMPWLLHILDGEKTCEVRGASLRPGGTWLGSGGRLYAWAELGLSDRVDTVEDFQARLAEHCVVADTLPYRRTFLTPLLRVQLLDPPIPYVSRPGPVTWARFQAPAPPPRPRWRAGVLRPR